MRFAHFSDSHLGFRQYGIYERELDFYRAFERAVAGIARERPDFVLHSGDLFDSPKPPPRALWVAQRAFSKLRERGIPVYAITGNHDMLFRRGAMPPQVLYKSLGVNLLTEDEPFVVHKGVFIGGVPYHSKNYVSALRESLGVLSKKAGKYGKAVIMLHQGIDRYLPKGYEIELNEIPKNFTYYAMGHIHSRIKERFGKGMLLYPGSTELWSASEYDDYRRNGKGFTLVDIGGDEPAVQNVNIQLEREIMHENITALRLDRQIAQLADRLSRLAKRPLLYLDVKEAGFGRSSLHDVLTGKLAGLVLSLRVSYVMDKDKAEKVTLARSFGMPQVQEILQDVIHDKNKAKLAGMLFESLAAGNDEQAAKEAENFYKNTKGEKA